MENILFNEDGTYTITKYNMYIQNKGGQTIDTSNTRCFKIGCNYYGFNGYYSNWWNFYSNYIITTHCGCNEDDTYYENYSYTEHELPIEMLFTIKHFQAITGHLNNYNETNIERSLLFYKNNPNLFPTKK
jgi:hypothetical protein